PHNLGVYQAWFAVNPHSLDQHATPVARLPTEQMYAFELFRDNVNPTRLGNMLAAALTTNQANLKSIKDVFKKFDKIFGNQMATASHFAPQPLVARNPQHPTPPKFQIKAGWDLPPEMLHVPPSEALAQTVHNTIQTDYQAATFV